MDERGEDGDRNADVEAGGKSGRESEAESKGRLGGVVGRIKIKGWSHFLPNCRSYDN